MDEFAKKEGVSILTADNIQQELQSAKEILYGVIDKKTVLFLSGGSTPKALYEEIAREKILKPGAVALVDERYGEINHPDSNEKMIRETGFVSYLQSSNVRFYPILENKDFEKTVKDYDETVRLLLSKFPKSVGIFGMGNDGHTAGIAPNKDNFVNPLFGKDQENLFVSCFDDGNTFQTGFGKRITLTFKAMEMFDFLIIFVFGSSKKNALSLMFKQGSLEEIPSRFYLKPEISKKTLLITDQKV
ncbi:MAG: 6-phosphogluconolactonase [Candidatus Levyibacteriota bacterium]